MRNPLQIPGSPATDSSLRDGDNIGAVDSVDLSGTGVLHTATTFVGYGVDGSFT